MHRGFGRGEYLLIKPTVGKQVHDAAEESEGLKGGWGGLGKAAPQRFVRVGSWPPRLPRPPGYRPGGLLFAQDEMEKGTTRQRLHEECLLTNGLCQAQPPADQCETGSRRGTRRNKLEESAETLDDELVKQGRELLAWKIKQLPAFSLLLAQPLFFQGVKQFLDIERVPSRVLLEIADQALLLRRWQVEAFAE